MNICGIKLGLMTEHELSKILERTDVVIGYIPTLVTAVEGFFRLD